MGVFEQDAGCGGEDVRGEQVGFDLAPCSWNIFPGQAKLSTFSLTEYSALCVTDRQFETVKRTMQIEGILGCV